MFRKRLQQITFFRTLRVRLAFTFLLLLTVVLVLVGVVVITTLSNVLDSQSEEALRDKLGTMKGYLHFADGSPIWFRDPDDSEEEATVGRLKEIFVVANEKGEIWQASTDEAFENLWSRENLLSQMAQTRAAKEPLLKNFVGKDRLSYQLISSIRVDDRHKEWLVELGRPLQQNEVLVRRFRRNYFIFLPIALIACAAVSWYSAGRALLALHSVERAAQEIKGSNLGLQIPERGADDELDHLIGSFNQMSRRLKKSFEQIRQFSTDVSHELRTPLTAIQGQLEVALFTATRPEQLREAIENALQDVERLSNLVRALLLLSQSESGQIPMHKAVVDLGEIVAELVDQFQIPAEANDLKLTQSTAGPVFCEADQTQMERVVTNLLANAIKYTPPGGWIRTHAYSTGTDVFLNVEDSGVGIPADHLPHIFDRFYRVPDPNPEKGLGLGLSFVSSIVDAHGGQIKVTSEIGKGTKFQIILPAGAVPLRVEAPLFQG